MKVDEIKTLEPGNLLQQEKIFMMEKETQVALALLLQKWLNACPTQWPN